MYTNMGMKGHSGVDFYAVNGTPLYATHDGLASYQVDGGGGHGVVVISHTKFNIDNVDTKIKTVYWHMCDPLKQPNFESPIADKTGFVPVNNGDLIGYADNTGLSTGSHLHFALKPVEEGENAGTWMNTQVGNGYFGAVDPMPYFDKSTPIQVQLMKKEVSLLSTVVALLKKLLGK
jgi:murein DD-endopeptidase MepM/ murein hydrolase activator NlpD